MAKAKAKVLRSTYNRVAVELAEAGVRIERLQQRVNRLTKTIRRQSGELLSMEASVGALQEREKELVGELGDARRACTNNRAYLAAERKECDRLRERLDNAHRELGHLLLQCGRRNVRVGQEAVDDDPKLTALEQVRVHAPQCRSLHFDGCNISTGGEPAVVVEEEKDGLLPEDEQG